MSQMIPALQKFYNALRHLVQFSTQSSFFDNVGSVDVFLSEYRSTTFALQTSIGGPNNPIYKNHLEKILLWDKEVAKGYSHTQSSFQIEKSFANNDI